MLAIIDDGSLFQGAAMLLLAVYALGIVTAGFIAAMKTNRYVCIRDTIGDTIAAPV